ncbi:hypothetical protein PV05_06967 [Exophiala xenobiotica]|uniref:E3 ubiquitin protein ligase n=1 Tax=Exophiala xenobiotica TaxID=348802 RepID=A0A0D2EGS3_9EURO|nr:uncharacterized protein PV05_06967 [Exophiala xenobiotica]KIW54618.1 hypothetical protein PV05_06967 [Exophiala xenobiotica]
MASQTSGRNSVGLDAARGTPNTARGLRAPTGSAPVDVHSLNATWTRLHYVTQQCAGFQKESCDIQRILWTNIHTLLAQKTSLERSWWDIHTAYSSKTDELDVLAENSVILKEELNIAQQETEAARRMAAESEARCMNLAEQQTFLQGDLNQARERIRVLENGVAVQERTIDTADHPKDAVVHELDSSENGMTTVRILELQARIKEMEQEYEHMVGGYKNTLSSLEARLSLADQKLERCEQTTARTRSTDLIVSPAIKREPPSSGHDENIKTEDNEVTGRGGRRQPKRARRGRKLEPKNSELRVVCY